MQMVLQLIKNGILGNDKSSRQVLLSIFFFLNDPCVKVEFKRSILDMSISLITFKFKEALCKKNYLAFQIRKNL